MSDNRKYYYLKLKENYFDDDSIILLESMQDGILCSNILLKHGGQILLPVARTVQKGGDPVVRHAPLAIEGNGQGLYVRLPPVL